MTVKKRAFVKCLRYIFPIIAILVIATVIRYKKGEKNSEQQAQIALAQLISCSLQQAEDFDAAVTLASTEAVPDSEIGLAKSDGKLREYLIERFGDSMTDSCIEDLAMSRTFYRSITMAKNFSSDIKTGEIELKKCSGEQECYTFSAEIKTSAGNLAATAWGTILMKKDGRKWKASQITLNMKETQS